MMLKFALVEMPEKTRVEEVRFVRVTNWLALVLPTGVLAKLRLAGPTVTGVVPVPERPIVCGLLTAPSMNDSVPVSVPITVGVYVTPTVHFAPAARLVPQVLEATAKSWLAKTPEKVSATFSWFTSVTDLLAPVFPATTFPNANALTDRVTGVIPVPERAAVCGLEAAPSVTVSVPLAEPEAIGENAIRIWQVAPPARLAGLKGHVPPTCMKGAVTAMLLIVNGIV